MLEKKSKVILSKPVLAIIVPCYNEEEILEASHAQLAAILGKLKTAAKISEKSFIAYVDDGSCDRTWQLIEKIQGKAQAKVKAIKLSKNFGHQNALLAGMLSVAYDICVTIDADLQDSPDAIANMVDKYAQGYQIVYGVRKERSSDTFFKRFTAQGFYLLMKILGVKIVDHHADFRLLSKEVVDALKEFKEVNIFLRGIIPFIGFESTLVHYPRSPRKAGQTKYSLKKMLHFAWEGVTSFSIVPLRITTFVGVGIFIATIIFSLYILAAKFSGKTIQGWTSLMLSIYFLSGLIMLSVGIIGEYVAKIYMEVKQRPRFILEQKIE